MMPPWGNGRALPQWHELDVLLHQTLTERSLGALPDAAERASLPAEQAASVREMRRQWRQANQLPEDLVQAKAWPPAVANMPGAPSAAPTTGKAFCPTSARSSLARREANLRAEASGTHPTKRSWTSSNPACARPSCKAVFGAVKQWLPGLIDAVVQAIRRAGAAAPGPFPVEAQRALGLEVMRLLGFDFEAGRLDVSTHPLWRRA